MIHFFRKIRYKLSQNNQFFKYLKYAVGEIVLVVIGILIALQINNWNERQKDIQNSRDYLMEFRKDLIRDTLSFSKGKQTLNREMEEELWALKKIAYTQAEADSILLAKNTVYFERKINIRTFQNVQNSGNSKLTGFDNLFVELSDYYTTTKELVDAMANWEVVSVTNVDPYEVRFKEDIEYDNTFTYGARHPEVTRDFPMISDPQKQAEKLVAFATSVVGRNHLKENYRRHMALERTFDHTIAEAKKLIELIDIALDE